MAENRVPQFSRPARSRVYQEVVAQIQAAIVRGDLRPGDRLPSERELQEMFRTSRGTLREALRILEQKGLIEVRLGVGGGAVVKRIGTDQMTETLTLMIQSHQVTPAHLVEFREEVEGAVTALAAERVTPTDRERLHALLERAAACLKDAPADAAAFLKADIDLHVYLGRISRNPIYVAVLKMIHENILDIYAQYSLDDEYALQTVLDDLTAIVDAVTAGRAAEARELARGHVRWFFRYKQQRDPDKPPPEESAGA